MHWKNLVFLICLLCLIHYTESSMKARRIRFGQCQEYIPKPKALFMSCANRKGICNVIKGTQYTIRAIFNPEINATNVDSYVAWNNGWLPIPLPNQERDACKNLHKCPLQAGKLAAFTYQLDIDPLWPSSEFPVIWTLTDRDTDEEVMCFVFRIQIR